MKEILFKGKQIDGGEWVEGTYYHQTEFYGDSIDESYIISSKDVLEDNMMIFYEVIPETVGQYSGKDDANGEKMFEGDIVKGLFFHSDSVLSVVTFKDGAFGLEWNRGTVKTFSAFASICNVRYEKIGNIHDNPELLKEGETE